MKKLVDLLLDDQSNKDEFVFGVCCDGCHKTYRSRPRRFSKSGGAPPDKEKMPLFAAIYEQEHRAARLDAVSQLAEHFNYCPVCKQVVCDECFLICADIDMCRGCAERLKETGVSVASDQSVAV